MESKVEIITISENHHMTFLYAPTGYRIARFKLENHKSECIGRLNNFNRIKKIASWKVNSADNLTAIFTEALKRKGWDFEKFPNPYAFISSIKITE